MLKAKAMPPTSYLLLKRVLDLIGAALGILILSPLLIFIALLIKIENPNGAVLFKQIRLGQRGQPFHMYKFRTMVCNADAVFEQIKANNEIQGKMFKMKQDPRITSVGRFLRQTSLDELPQLWNVILGDMSLVGPRPPLEREYSDYTEQDKRRLDIRPGCTGLWQVSGRNSLSFEEMVSLDIQYIEGCSLMLDLYILIKTIPVMILRKDAY